MKYFGEYLVEKQIVSAEHLVQAVLQQNRNQPLVAQIAYEKRIFSAEEMIKIFSSQQKNEQDFFAAGISSGLMTEEKKKSLENELQQHHLPLASVLLKNGAVGVKALVHALDEFLSTAKVPSPKKYDNNLKVNAPKIANLPTFKFHKIDPVFSAELQGALSKNKILEMINIIQLVKQNASVKDLVQTFLQDVLKSVHTIRGLAKAAKAPIIDQICSLMDAAIVKELRSEQPNTQYINNTLTPAIEQALAFCEQIKDSVAKNQSEQIFWEQAENQELFSAISTKLSA